MTEYQARHPNPITYPVAPPPNNQGQTYQVAKKYKLVSMTELDTPLQQVERPKTVDQEFALYTGVLSPQGTDIIKFWAVSIYFALGADTVMLTTILCRCQTIKKTSLQSTGLPWIICPFRHRQFHVNAYSPQPARRIQSAEIDSIQTCSKRFKS